MADRSFWTGAPGEIEKQSIYNPQQESVLNYLMQSGQSGLQQTPLDFSPIEKAEVTRFNQQTIPAILEQLTSMSGDDVSSSLGQSLGEAGAGLSERLAAMKANYNLQGRGQLLNMLGMGLQPRDEMFYRPESYGFLGSLGSGLSQGLGTGLGMLGGSYLGGVQTNPLMKLLNMLKNKKQPQQNTTGSITYSNQIPNDNLA